MQCINYIGQDIQRVAAWSNEKKGSHEYAGGG